MIPFDQIQAVWQEFKREYDGRYRETRISDYWAMEKVHGIPVVDGRSPNEVCIAVRLQQPSSELPEIYQGIPVVYLTT